MNDRLTLTIVGLCLTAQLAFALAGAWLSSWIMTAMLALWGVYALAEPAVELDPYLMALEDEYMTEEEWEAYGGRRYWR